MSAVLAEIIEKISQLSEEEQEKVQRAMDEQTAIRNSRHEFIRSIRGKHRDALSPVDDFIARKQEDIDIEDRGWRPDK